MAVQLTEDQKVTVRAAYQTQSSTAQNPTEPPTWGSSDPVVCTVLPNDPFGYYQTIVAGRPGTADVTATIPAQTEGGQPIVLSETIVVISGAVVSGSLLFGIPDRK